MDFFDAMQNELNTQKTITTNGAIAYASSGKKLLDFNFGITAMRNMSNAEIIDKFVKVFFEDKTTAIEYLFYLGDIRGGLGERKIFRAILEYIATEQPKIANAVIELIPYYNRWDTLINLYDYSATKENVVRILKNQIKNDVIDMEAGKPISLCAKWMPSINASSKDSRTKAFNLCSDFGWSISSYRKLIARLRKYLNIVEVKMSAKEWDKISYESVPSKANLIYNNAFIRNDEQRRREYLASLKNGNTKINASTLAPHEICARYRGKKGEDDTLEALWKALPDLTVDNTLVVRDGSGSMTWGRCGNCTPLDVATALAIYMSEHNTGVWKDKFITFSSNPKIVNLGNCESLREKIDLSMRETDCSNTNIYKTMMLILNTAKHNHISKEEMPKMIVICSDMQFDGRRDNLDKSLFDDIAFEYNIAGYELPKICFWNLDTIVSSTIPMQQNKLGLILCSGFTVQILKMFMSNKINPYEVLLDTLHSERYDKVREVIGGLT